MGLLLLNSLSFAKTCRSIKTASIDNVVGLVLDGKIKCLYEYK